jgi:hypothetical protein
MTTNRVTHSSLFRWLLLGLVVLSLSAASFAQVFVSVRFGPPALPIYAQPLCPGPGFMWTPGYWGWNDDGGYYWVPGTWVVAPVGLLWTPGYWGWGGGFYAWHAGYWGPHIGFYGGINYGFGYGGVGFVGGEWRGGAFFYNRAVTNVSVTSVTNVYTHTVVVNENHTAFNGGEGGLAARPTPAEEAAEHEQHTPALAEQTQHEHLASQNRANFASENHGSPAVAATARAGDFSSHSAVSARAAGSEYHAPVMSPKEARVPASEAGKGSSSSSSNDGFRSFTPPSKSASSPNANERTTANEDRNESSRVTDSRTNESQPKENAPKQSSHKPAPAPKNSNKHAGPPPREHGKSR